MVSVFFNDRLGVCGLLEVVLLRSTISQGAAIVLEGLLIIPRLRLPVLAVVWPHLVSSLPSLSLADRLGVEV